MAGKTDDERRARFVCVISIARQGRAIAIVSDFAPKGDIANEPRGIGGFGYDPVFLFPDSGRTYAEAIAGGKKYRTVIAARRSARLSLSFSQK